MDIIFAMFVAQIFVCALVAMSFGCLLILRRKKKELFQKIEEMPDANIVTMFHMVVGFLMASVVFTSMTWLIYNAMVKGGN